MSYGAKEIAKFIVDNPQDEASKKGTHTDYDCPPHIFPCFCIVYSGEEQIYTSSQNETSQGRVGNLMKCRIFDVHVNSCDGDCGKHERCIDGVCNCF